MSEKFKNHQKSDYLTISDFSKAICISQTTIRKWEKDGKLIPHHKTPGGRRFYSKEQVRQFLNEDE